MSQTQKDFKFITAVQCASLTALPVWYPFYKMNTLAKQEILYSCQPNNMSHLSNFYSPNLKSLKGFSAYYRGILPAMMMQPLFPICLYGKEQLSRKLFDSKPNMYQDCMLAAGIGCSTAFVATPLNVILTQMFRNKDAHAISTIKELYQKQGIKRFFSGLSAFTLRNALFCTGLTVIYPKTQEAITTQYPQVVPFKADVLAAGVFSAIVCSGSVDFFDIIGVMRQSHEYKGNSASSLLKTVYIKHGIKGLFVGFSPKIAQVTAEIIVFNETFKYLMRYLNETN